jgi:aryl-alcohol dehydrogenase-like predicted oxidoreductase
MRYRQLGRSGLTVSVVGLGCRSFGGGRSLNREQARVIVQQAVDAGITFFDTAASYADGESEEFLGEALKACRHDVVIATKFGGPRAVRPSVALSSRRYIRHAVEDSLRRLQTDYIDLYQCHVPDPKTPIEETLSVLDDLVHEGKVRYIGSSNFPAWQVLEAEWVARSQNGTRFIAAQNQYNLLRRDVESDLAPICVRYGIGIIPVEPLYHGFLAGRYPRGTSPARTERGDELSDTMFDRLEALQGYARDRGIGLLEVAIGGLAARPGLGSVIAGATRPEHVVENTRAGDWVPTPADMQALEEILRTSS